MSTTRSNHPSDGAAPRRRSSPRAALTRALPWLACGLLASACAAPTEGVEAPTGRLAIDVAPLESASIHSCQYDVELLVEEEPGKGKFVPYLSESHGSNGPAGAWSRVVPCHAGLATGEVGEQGESASRLNLARVTVTSCLDDSGEKVQAAFPYTQSRLFECVAERDTALAYTFFIEIELARGFADIVAMIFGFEISAKADCQPGFLPFEDEQGFLSRMPAMIAALAYRAPANLAIPIELHSYYAYNTEGALPAGVGVQEYVGTELDEVTEYHNIAAPAPRGSRSSLDRYAFFGPAGTVPAQVGEGLPVLTWNIRSSGEGGDKACDVTATTTTSACQLLVSEKDGQSAMLGLLPATEDVDGQAIAGLTVLGGTRGDGAPRAPSRTYFARDEQGKPMSITAVTCCVDGCCTGEGK